MPRLVRTLPTLLVGLALLAFAVAGCDGSSEVASLSADVKDLQAQAKKAASERDKLADRLQTAERRIAGLQEDLLQVREDAQNAIAAVRRDVPTAGAAAAAVGSVGGAPGAQADAKTLEAAKSLGDILATEEGRAVFDQAMQAYQARQEADRGNRMAGDMVEAFAQKANLSPQQKASMLKIVTAAMTELGDAWRGLRDPNLTPDERNAKRQDAIAKMQEVSQKTDDEVKAILDGAQYETYQQEKGRMRGFLGGGGGFGGGGFGGPGGGFGGRGGQGR